MMIEKIGTPAMLEQMAEEAAWHRRRLSWRGSCVERTPHL